MNVEEGIVSPVFADALNFLSLGLSVVLLFAVAYLWSSNNNKSAQIEAIQSELKRMKKTLSTLQEKVSQMREPKVVSEVEQAEPFGIDLTEPLSNRMTPLAPQDPWITFIDDYNELAEEMKKPGQLFRCEKFVRDNKLRILTYGGALTFRPAIDVKDSGYWAFKCDLDEYAVVPNPMNPCDEELHAHGGMREIFALNYQEGVYKKYFVKLPALFNLDVEGTWQLKSPGVVNLERK
ncbi:MAG: hypothetical protein IKN16_11090 [Selenomonadaceae bacterium]|nr:hypothetical protein [Selenomonadaceae bacterium]MBR6888967.1 hypothetical protein [Selenomonadaceae bacterium]